MVEIPPEIVASIGTGIPETIVANLITSFLIELGTALNRISKQHKYDIPPISYEGLEDFWKAYKKQEIKRGDPVCIYGVFSDLGLAMPASRPDEAVRAVRDSLEELLRCFSDDSDLELQKQIFRFDAHIDVLRLWLGSCIRLLPIKGFRYCTLFDENDIIPVRGLPVFLRKSAQIKSPPFYGEVRGYVADLPPNWKRILKVENKKPLAIVVDSDAGGKLEKHEKLTNPLYLSYWMILKYTNGDGCIVATRGDYSDKKNYKACRNFLKTIAEVEIKKMKAQLLFEYDQVNRITRYKQVLDQRQIDEILEP
jgi:hypothetical protein